MLEQTIQTVKKDDVQKLMLEFKYLYTLCAIPNTLGKIFVKLAAETHLLTVFLNIRWSMAFLSSFFGFF